MSGVACDATRDGEQVGDRPVVGLPAGRRGENGSFLRRLGAAEDLLVALLLAAMVILPLLEIALRQSSRGLPSAPEFLRHLTLLVGMAGGALAAREGRLLALASPPEHASALRRRGRAAAGGVGAAVCGWLGLAGARFVTEERLGGATLAYGIPLWCVQLALPLGFGLVAARLVLRAAETPSARLGVLAVAVAAALAGPFVPAWLALGALLLATLGGAPIVVTLGGAALVWFHADGVPVTAVAIQHYSLVTNPALPAIPLFTLAGCFMAEGGAARRLVRLFQALSRGVRGGPAIATALACAFFTAFTGGSGVTILALGGLLLPVLIGARLSDRDALGLITGAGSLGILLPPCLPVILYAIIAKVDINTMFLAGLIPAALLIALTAGWGVWVSPPAGRADPAAGPAARLDPAEIVRAACAAKWELLMPVFSLALLFSGWATPVEAAAATAAYAFVVEVVVCRDLTLADCRRAMTEAGLLIGGILLILGVALGLTSCLLDAQVPHALAEWSHTHVPSRWLFLLALNVVLILVGSVVEIFAAIVIVAPLLVPIGLRLGIDPLHLGIIFLANMELGFLAPPVGLNLLLAAARLRRPVAEVARATLPLLLVLFAGVLLITYVPALTTWLPGLFPS